MEVQGLGGLKTRVPTVDRRLRLRVKQKVCLGNDVYEFDALATRPMALASPPPHRPRPSLKD